MSSPVLEFERYVTAQVNLVRVCDRACKTLRQIAKKLERDERKHQQRISRRTR